MHPSWHICVLIPARNEEKLLARCLESVKAAVAALPPAVTSDVIVAVDSSTDRTWEIASKGVEGFGSAIRSSAGAVGKTRAMATELALRRCKLSSARCWLANTDADSVVPRNWLTLQLASAEAGVAAIAGTINVDDYDDHDAIVEQRFHQTYLIEPDGTHKHVHGANVGFRADIYMRAGGWNALTSGEDHDLWARISALQVKKASVNNIRVLTSGRRIGRAPKGFADALAAHNDTPHKRPVNSADAEKVA